MDSHIIIFLSPKNLQVQNGDLQILGLKGGSKFYQDPFHTTCNLYIIIHGSSLIFDLEYKCHECICLLHMLTTGLCC